VGGFELEQLFLLMVLEQKLLMPPHLAAAFLSAGVCPLNYLVGANSPSLCPTISSETVIGIKVLPL
jgi:hypothetical protein